jgi:hypothetical protein
MGRYRVALGGHRLCVESIGWDFAGLVGRDAAIGENEVGHAGGREGMDEVLRFSEIGSPPEFRFETDVGRVVGG